MENANVTITLTVAQWQSMLDALGHAPHIIVNSVSPIISDLQAQAAPQMAEIEKNLAAESTESAEPATDEAAA